jgi:hypothetical protein
MAPRRVSRIPAYLSDKLTAVRTVEQQIAMVKEEKDKNLHAREGEATPGPAR